MGILRDVVNGEAVERDAYAQSLPPLQTETPAMLGVAQGPDHYVKRALHTIALPFTMTVEGLTRFEDSFQATVLTAFGRIPRSQFGQWQEDIWSGKRRIDGETFSQLAGWSAFRDTLDRINVIPGWVKEVAGPEGYMTKKPRLSFGNIFDFAIEGFISPYAVIGGATELGIAGAAKVGKIVDMVSLPVTAPLKLMGKAVFSPETPWGAFLFRLRDPTAAMGRFPDLVRRLILDGKAMEDGAEVWRKKLLDIYRDHRVGINFTDWLKGYRVNAAIRRDVVWDALDSGERRLLNEHESKLVDDIVDKVLVPLKQHLAETGDDVLKLARRATVRRAPQSFRPGATMIQPGGARGREVITTGEALARERVQRGRTVTWDPRRDLMKPFTLTPKNFVREAQSIGDKDFAQRTNVFMPWKASGMPKEFDPRLLRPDQKDPFHALDFFIGQAERRHVLYRPGGLFNEKTGFRPTTEFGKPGQNPRLLGMTDVEFNYWLEKVHSITGNMLRKPDIILERVGQRFMDGLRSTIASVDRQGRIQRVLRDWGVDLQNPRIGRPSSISAILVARQMQNMLGGSLAGAIKNTSQLLNEAAVSGVPAVIKGLYRSVYWGSEEGRILKDARKLAKYESGMMQLAHAPEWGSFTVGNRMETALMKPFTAVENFVRGVSHNVSVGEALEARGIKTLAQWENLAAPLKKQIIDDGIIHSMKANFVYGIAGRSALMMHPVARIAGALQSYSWKQAEFAANLFKTDGLAFTRLVNMHGWAIEMAYHGAGINAENWLGWGFLPPNGLIQPPALEALQNATGLLYAFANDDEKGVTTYVDKMRGSLREVARMFGDPDDTAGMQASIGAAAQFGLLPIPIVAIGKTAKLVNEFLTGRSEGGQGRIWRPVTRQEALTSYFFQTHASAEFQRLQSAEANVRASFDGQMRRRVHEFVSALRGQDGQKVHDAAERLFEGVPVRIPITGKKLGPGMFMGDEDVVHPTPSMVEDRLKSEMMRQTVPAGVREMMESGWTSQVLWALYSRGALRDMEAGRIRQKTTGGQP